MYIISNSARDRTIRLLKDALSMLPKQGIKVCEKRRQILLQIKQLEAAKTLNNN